MAPVERPMCSLSDSSSSESSSHGRADSGSLVAGFRETFQMGRRLGSGTFGDVYTCTDKGTGEEYACKSVPKRALRSRRAQEELRREVSLLRVLKGRHPGVVQLQGTTETEDSVHILMEICSGGDLFDLVCTHGRLPEPAARHVFRQLASALNFCHYLGILHRDLKPENILFDRPALELYNMTSSDMPAPEVQAKLADFGLSIQLPRGSKTEGFVGSPRYVAPEVVLGKAYGRRADVWSLGVVLCAMLTGRAPFHGKTKEDEKGMLKAIVHKPVDFSKPCWDGISQEAKHLVFWMLQKAPSDRATSFDILCHPWATGEKCLSTPTSPASPASPAPSLPAFSEVSCQ